MPTTIARVAAVLFLATFASLAIAQKPLYQRQRINSNEG